MSRHSSYERVVSSIVDSPDALAVIREEQNSPGNSSININDQTKVANSKMEQSDMCPCLKCGCKGDQVRVDPEEVEILFKAKEEELLTQFNKKLDTEIHLLKERFDFILQNEQARTAFMLREAHRERQEKISALQTQLECKNLAGLMYVMCTERKKSKLEKLKMIEDYTHYIQDLQAILSEGQALILHLSRGYKTAARVEYEWREKMKKIMKEFQAFIYHYAGGTPESNQYFFDMRALMKTESPIVDDPNEDPCECEPAPEPEPIIEKTWWEKLEDDCRPFVMFGDMADFEPPQRRQVLKEIKAAKTAPQKWKEYVFNDMFMKAECPNVDVIKDEYWKRTAPVSKWECHSVQTQEVPILTRSTDSSRRVTSASVDIRGDMGSILKIITASAIGQSTPKTTLLGARDSMEIASTTKLREKHRQSSQAKSILKVTTPKVEPNAEDTEAASCENSEPDLRKSQEEYEDKAVLEETLSPLGSLHHDSLQMIQVHKPEKNQRVNFEKRRRKGITLDVTIQGPHGYATWRESTLNIVDGTFY